VAQVHDAKLFETFATTLGAGSLSCNRLSDDLFEVGGNDESAPSL
jgi:hypothetical protein